MPLSKTDMTRSPTKTVSILSAVLAIGTPAEQALPAKPPLPTPCLPGACGNSPVSSFVTYGAAGAAIVGNTLNVTQTTNKAILNWADFNISQGYKVNFVQPSATSAALNQIWSADPSVIAGSMTANGQVYLYNQNGILFDKGAQINVGGLTASSLALSPALFQKGILSNNDPTQPVFQNASGSTPGAITVNPGASLTAADGGRILLLGSAVSNGGTISTPDGQTILAAAPRNAYLAASSDPSMRGLLIEVDGGGSSGTVINSGQISAPRGNITLAGLMVNQSGLLSATTSVAENGSIYLMAGDVSGGGNFYEANPKQNAKPTAFGGLAPNVGGKLTLTPGSVTEVLPDATDTGSLTVAQQGNFIPSQIDLAGQRIVLAGSAAVRAPAGQVYLYAAGNPYHAINSSANPLADQGSIYLDSGSSIDVSGLSAVEVPVTQNLLQITLETNDLQDDPLQRSGFLHGATVTVNASQAPALFNIQPYLNNISAGIDQILTKAGDIQLAATGDVVARQGSSLNVSGGSVAYQGAYGPATTNLLGADGKVYNIATAPKAVEYVGIANGYSQTDPTWGTTTKVSSNTYYAGYTQGASAGGLTVETPLAYLRGNMLAGTVAGINQRAPAMLPAGGTLQLGCQTCVTENGQPEYGLNGGVSFDNGLKDTLGATAIDAPYASLITQLPATTEVSPAQLTRSGFNTFDIYSNGLVQLPAGASLALAANGAVNIQSASAIDVAGEITGPGIAVSMQTVLTNDQKPHSITLADGALIDASGSWVNDSPTVTAQPGTAPTAIAGGKVSLSAAGDIVLGNDTRIDVSGGGWINQNNALSAGAAGSIALKATFSAVPSNLATNPYTGRIVLTPATQLRGASLSGTGAGQLTLQSGSVTVGSAAAGTPGELLISPQFFNQGGFSSYSLTGLNDLTIGSVKDSAGGTPVRIAPVEQTLAFNASPFVEPTGASLAGFTHLETLPQRQRSPVSLSFASNASDKGGAEIGDVTLARDASIVTDPGASVSLIAGGYNGSVRVFGDISAPAGNIRLINENQTSGIQTGADPGYLPDQQILLGSGAVLSATASVEADSLNPLSYVQGQVLPGGTVSLIANKGSIVTSKGSLIDVSGVAGVLDIATSQGVTPTTVTGGAGTVNLEAREGLVLQGTLNGRGAEIAGAAVPGAASGSLNIELGHGYDYGIFEQLNGQTGSIYPTATRVLTLSGADSISPSTQGGAPVDGAAVVTSNLIASGGFQNVSLRSADSIDFAGNPSLRVSGNLTLEAPAFTSEAGVRTSLSGAYVSLGNYANTQDYFSTPSPNAAAALTPTAGTGTLEVDAQLIDVRGISGWSGFAGQTLSSTGDIRFIGSQNFIQSAPSVGLGTGKVFEGAFNTTGNLTLKAAQVYPSTATAFAINDMPVDAGTATAPTTVLISNAGRGTASTPLSAGGDLVINASNITQDGTLRAPLGQISLNAVALPAGDTQSSGTVTLGQGSQTSVSAAGLIIPYGSTANGTQWTYTPGAFNPTDPYIDIVGTPPAKQIGINGSAVNIRSGAKVDLSGGGDLYAYEYIAGQGGSVDVLNPTNAPAGSHPAGTTIYTYAIVPTLGSQFAPFDAQYSRGSSAAVGQTITLSGVPGLATGTYALLPAYYALLPGAFAVQVLKTDSGLSKGTTVRQPDGAYVVAGQIGNASAGVQDNVTSTVLVAPDSIVRTHAQYDDTYANSFFYGRALAAANAAGGSPLIPALPADSGQLLLQASRSLDLEGSLTLTPGQFSYLPNSGSTPVTEHGRGGDVAIEASNLQVVDAVAAGSAGAGVVQLDVHQLDNLNAQTLILGAAASETQAGEQLTLGSQTVTLNNSTALTAPEIIVAAQDTVTVGPSAQIAASTASTVTPPAQTLVVPGGGALLRVSSGAAANLTVDPATLPATPVGTVSIGAGANVHASGSLLLYGSASTTLDAAAKIQSPSASLYSSTVSLGDAPGGTTGLVLTSQLLGSLKGLTDLTLGSASTINLYGPVQLGTAGSATPGLSRLSLQAGAIGGFGSGDKILEAGDVVISNPGGSSAGFSSTPDGSGALKLIASGKGASATGSVTLGQGDKLLSGFGAVDIAAAGDIVLQGRGSLDAGGAAAAVPVSLSGVALVSSAAANQSISTHGALAIEAVKAASSSNPVTPGLAGRLAISAGSIAQNGVIDLPGGTISLTATSGDLTLGANSATEAAGSVQSIGTQQAAIAGGRISLTALNGNIDALAGARLDVSGATSGDGGSAAGALVVSAPHGQATLAGGRLAGSAPSGLPQGAFSLDEATGLSGSGLDDLTSVLSTGGFTGDVSLRSRLDPTVNLSERVKASSFSLSADAGTISIASTGVIDTSGGTTAGRDGGAIRVWGGTGLTVDGGAQLLANAGAPGPEGANGTTLATRGGSVTLGTASGELTLDATTAAPITISSRGSGDATTDGTLTLRAPRTADGTNVQIAVSTGVNAGTRQPVVVEGVKTYVANELGVTDINCGSGGSCDVADQAGVLYTDAQSFLTNLHTLPANLAGLPASAQIRPGIEIDSPSTGGSRGDLTLDAAATVWDLAAWNAALGAPVNVTLRSAGNLILGASLSDGFTSNAGVPSSWVFGSPTGAAAGSASYRLAAGADLTAADPLAVTAQPVSASSLGAPPNSGNFILTPGSLVRTGSGSIEIAAGGDALIGYSFNGYDANGNLQVAESDPQTAAIYTAGVPSVLSDAQSALFTAPNVSRFLAGATAGYPTAGGDVSVLAQDDIRSAISAQTLSDWLWRRAPFGGALTSSAATTKYNTTWWVMFPQFRQGVGVLGGGDLTLEAGRDIVNTSAVVPTTGRLLFPAAGATPTLSELLLTGGGNLRVHAGGDIISGVFENDWGNSRLSAGGSLASSADSTFLQQFPDQAGNGNLPLGAEVYPILSVGNGTFDVSTGGDALIGGITNGTTLPITTTNATVVQNVTGSGAFFAYAPDSNPGTLNITSAGGRVALNVDALNNTGIVALSNAGITYVASGSPAAFLATYPSTVNVAALSGDVDFGDATLARQVPNGVAVTLFPSAAGNLRLLAQGSISNDGAPYALKMSEADPAQVPTALNPGAVVQFGGVSGVNLPATPLHQADGVPISIVAATGTIDAGSMVFPKQAQVIAGADIADLNYQGKNLNPSDVTLIESGGQIRYSTPTLPITNQLVSNLDGISVGGPGALEVLAGGSINLGDGLGIVTSGSLADPRLPSGGATMIVGAGFGAASGGLIRQPAYQSFIKTYLAPDAAQAPSTYGANLIAYMEKLDPVANAGISYSSALSAFKQLSPSQQLPLLAAVLLDELSATGLAHNSQGTGYARGYDAINALFPAASAQGATLQYSGDLNMFYSQLKTESGGDIYTLVPGGSVVVGVANPAANLNTVKGFFTASGQEVPGFVDLGILALASGTIQGFAAQNFEVNQSRILTLEGGDIILWASNGDIDAGKGAKSASGAPPPTIQTDSNGNLFVDPSNAVSGSGIGQLLTVPGIQPGLVNLIAPKGTVNAGDAGIRVAGNLNIAAVQVIGASNITVAGTSTGVPTSEAGAFAGALSGANSISDTSKAAVEQLSQDLGNASNYQQMTESLTPSFIVVKMFCLGVECQTQ